jgi:hypothetical protein
MICSSENFRACHANYSPDYPIAANTVPRHKKSGVYASATVPEKQIFS